MEIMFDALRTGLGRGYIGKPHEAFCPCCGQKFVLNNDGVGLGRENTEPCPACHVRLKRCDELRDRGATMDLDAIVKTLQEKSPTFRSAHVKWRQANPMATILLRVDYDMPESMSRCGSTTVGSCGDPVREIRVNPVQICKSSVCSRMTGCKRAPADLLQALIHELGHVLLCTPGLAPNQANMDQEEAAIGKYVEDVEKDLYGARGAPRDPFKAPF
jgi:hypothetical protein